MATWICLFRGINVGGKNIVAMKEFAAVFADVGCERIKTYIQSGNVVFCHPERAAAGLQNKITAQFEQDFGFRPAVTLIGIADYRRVVDDNPFPEAAQAPKTLHAFFLGEEAKAPDLTTIRKLKSDTETFAIHGKVFYLHAPEGIGRSKLAQRVEKLLGVATTARNWRTVEKLFELALETDR